MEIEKCVEDNDDCLGSSSAHLLDNHKKALCEKGDQAENCIQDEGDFEVHLKKDVVSIKQDRKRRQIEQFLEHSEKSGNQYLENLRSFALTEYGLVDDKIREKVWPELMLLEPEKYEDAPSEEEFKTHPEYSQVVLDVNRSLKRFPPGIPYEQRVAMQDQLIHLILRVIMKYPTLRYYQGYHDVAITFLLVVGENVAFHIMEKLSTDHLKHFMEPTMEKTSQLLNYVYPLLDKLHPQLCEYIERAEVGTMFCLPWFLTWYSHTLTKYELVVRFYDYFLASPPLLPLYLIPQIVVYRQDRIFSTECDMASLHQVLSQLPEDLPYERLLHKATALYHQCPPETIEKDAAERAKQKLIKIEEEMAMRRRKTTKRVLERRRWDSIGRILHQQWVEIPRFKFRIFLISVTFAIGAYALYKYLHISNDV